MDFHLDRYPVEHPAQAAPTGGSADYALAGIPVAQCATCHGADGSGGPSHGEASDLTLQAPAYLRATLNSCATARQQSGYMVFASQLSDSQVDRLAT